MLCLGEGSLRPAEVARLARRAALAGCQHVTLAAEAVNRVDRSVALRDTLIGSRQPIYGVTTGFGDSNVNQIAPEKAAALQQNLIRYHLVGSGPAAPAEVVRATMLIRANCLARGYSGVRREVIKLVLDCLANDILPIIPERGSVGASGDLIPSCYLADALTGHGEVEMAGKRLPAAQALAARGLRPAVLQPKEALALINGTSFMSAFAVLAASDSAELAFAADVCTALAVEVLKGNRGHFHPVVHACKPHPGQVHSAAVIRGLLKGSELCRDHDRVLSDNRELGDQSYQRLDHPIQDRYSLRCSPHVTGVLYDTLDWIGRWLEIEINSANDNPLFDADSGAVYNGGNFYGGHVGLAMDALKICVASVADLLDRQLSLVVDHKFSNGLPANLIPVTDQVTEAGLHHGFKGAQIACTALVAEALRLGSPATAFSRPTESNNQDKVSMGTIAARDARTVSQLALDATAIHLAALCQAADLRGPQLLGAGTRGAYTLVRKYVRFLDRDRRMDGELADLATALRHGALREAVLGDEGSRPVGAEEHVTGRDLSSQHWPGSG